MKAKAAMVKPGCTRLKEGTVLCISGMAGTGKSTVAKRIAEKYKLHYYSGGDTLKALALKAPGNHEAAENGWWESKEGMKFLEKRTQDSSFDKKVDEKLLKLAAQGNVVLDSWTMPWLLKSGFKVWLEASAEERARRIAKRDNIAAAEALQALKLKDQKTVAIYRKLYGFNLGEDFSPFDLILDVNKLDSEGVFQTLSLIVNRFCCPP